MLSGATLRHSLLSHRTTDYRPVYRWCRRVGLVDASASRWEDDGPLVVRPDAGRLSWPCSLIDSTRLSLLPIIELDRRRHGLREGLMCHQDQVPEPGG
jgi:hypothetical protein